MNAATLTSLTNLELACSNQLLDSQDLQLQIAIPADQRPVNELAQLRNGQLYSWVRSILIVEADNCTGTKPYASTLSA